MIGWIQRLCKLVWYENNENNENKEQRPDISKEVALNLLATELAERGVAYEHIPVHLTGLQDYINYMLLVDDNELLLVLCKPNEVTVSDVLTLEACKQQLLEYIQLGITGSNKKHLIQSNHYTCCSISTSIICGDIKDDVSKLATEFKCSILRIP